MRIDIHELEVLAHVGVADDERSQSQRLVVNITVWLRAKPAQLDDDFARTANYSAIAAEAQALLQRRSARLIETLANEIAGRLLEVFPISRARVEVRKFVLPQASYVSATVTRSG